MLSLAYLIEPSPEAGEAGISPKQTATVRGNRTRYVKHATQILNESFATEDLDVLISSNGEKRKEMVDETRELLVGCGFDSSDVNVFFSKHK